MRRVKISEEEKQYQTQHLLEKDLVALARQYHILEKACSHSQFIRGSTLLKSQKVLEIFRREHANIVLDLQRAAAPGRIRDDDKRFDELFKHLEENSFFTEKTRRHKVFIEEIEKERKKVMKEVKILRKQQLTDRQHEDRVWNAIKTLERLENELETQMRIFGTICTKNKQLRDQVDHLLWQRRIFIFQWRKLIFKLNEGKKIMLDLIQQATMAYNQRDEWCTKLHILRTKAYHTSTYNKDEMREHKRKHEQNQKLMDFFWIKGQKRITSDLERKNQEEREIVKYFLKTKLEIYRNMLAEIDSFATSKNVSAIAHNYVLQEEINLSNFKYIIDVIGQTDLEVGHLTDLYVKVENGNSLQNVRALQQQRNLHDLGYDLDDAEAETFEATDLLDETTSHLDDLLKGVSQLFLLCKCDKDPLIKLLGNNTKVNIFNVQLYLQILEQKIQRTLITAGFQDKANDKIKLLEAEKDPRIYTIDQIVLATPCSLCLEHELVSDVIDVLQRIWTKDEIKQKLKYRLKIPSVKAKIHRISHCQLPKARSIMQKRYE